VHEVGARTTTRTPTAPMTPLRDGGRLVARLAPPGLGPPPPGFGPPDRPPGPPPLELLVEIEPLLAQELTHQLARDLAVRGVLAVAVVLAGLALLRLSRRAEELAARSAHERRLSSLGEMSAVLAHELRNPLASLKGNGEAERLEALTESLLSFVRAGDLDRAWVDPCAPLRDLPDLSLDLDDAPPVWWLDAVRWGQVVANLTRNAVLAGGPTEVRVAGTPDALVLEVRDHGPGLPPDVPVAALFEPFRTTRTHGTGLGLAVVHRIVTQHAGTVTAANAPGGGAVFTVRVPSTGRSPA
jgi:two-component system sensor histidine kinase HydH